MILTRRPLRTHGRALGRPVAEPVSGGGRSVLALLGRSRDRLPAWVTFVAIDLVQAKQVHRDDEALSYLRRLLAARPAAAGDTLAVSAVETGQPLLVEHVHEALRGPIAEEHGPYVERCGLRSVLIAPL